MWIAFPWLFVSFISYNAIAFIKPGPAPSEPFRAAIGTIGLLSGVSLTLSVADVLIAMTLVLLLIEVIKISRAPASLIDHVLSIVLFLLCLVEFTVRKEAATFTFFLITLVAFMDVIAGFTITPHSVSPNLAVDQSRPANH